MTSPTDSESRLGMIQVESESKLTPCIGRNLEVGWVGGFLKLSILLVFAACSGSGICLLLVMSMGTLQVQNNAYSSIISWQANPTSTEVVYCTG